MKLDLNLHYPLTENQKRALKSKKEHLLLIGPAGTAKTYTALARGLFKYNAGEVERVVIIRSAVETRKIGHLPGDQQEKLDPYAAPYIELVSSLSPKKNFRALRSAGVIEFTSTTFLRGLTFDGAFIIVDEFQNLSAHELDTVMTRVGKGTQLVVAGDGDSQSDLPRHEQGEFRKVIEAFQSIDSVETVRFTRADIVRSGFVQDYYDALEALDGIPLPDSFRRRASVASSN